MSGWCCVAAGFVALIAGCSIASGDTHTDCWVCTFSSSFECSDVAEAVEGAGGVGAAPPDIKARAAAGWP